MEKDGVLCDEPILLVKSLIENERLWANSSYRLCAGLDLRALAVRSNTLAYLVVIAVCALNQAVGLLQFLTSRSLRWKRTCEALQPERDVEINREKEKASPSHFHRIPGLAVFAS